MWKELDQEYPEIFDHCVEKTLWNTTREREMRRPLTQVGVICLLEFKRMSDVTNHYVVRAKREVEGQYESLRSSFDKTMYHQGWMVEQVSFITRVRSLNEEELKKNLEYSRSQDSHHQLRTHQI